jgi:hypothetical protein
MRRWEEKNRVESRMIKDLFSRLLHLTAHAVSSVSSSDPSLELRVTSCAPLAFCQLTPDFGVIAVLTRV